MQIPLSLNIKSFDCLSNNHKDIIRYFYYWECRRRKEKLNRVFPKVSRIAEFSKCSIRTVQRFNKSVNGFLMHIQKDFRPNKSQTTNTYKMEQSFFEALTWLDRRNLLRAKKEEFEDIIKEAERFESIGKIKMSPPPNPKCHPRSLSSLSQTQKEYIPYVHPWIEKIKISQQDKVRLSKYPEFAIVKGVEDCVWYSKQGKRIGNAMHLLQNRISKHYRSLNGT